MFIQRKMRGRFVRLQYAELDNIEVFHLIIVGNIVITNPQFLNNQTWKDFPLKHLSACNYDIKQKETKQGNEYEVNVSAILGGFDGPTIQELDRLSNPKKQLLVKITTPKGYKFLCATQEYPSQMSYSLQGGSTETEFSKANLNFKTIMPHSIKQSI
jgi:hypothetical protein